ncbi:hypothetical protein [Ligilactobacillus equi]|uniref:Uncharacterized protein n=1 Tax=Ligilactobacillus equi DSM 15833 = JCM 10991 TaxID=1423740 RepID=A0A0R1TMR1_9LACO|nr:hypothetical protein [Ligilactobacillus equi]KRL79736.1 hypothetical protein FC36_GL000365 [Ligilactobacillus equi DSM 15833 = JCM 10991]
MLDNRTKSPKVVITGEITYTIDKDHPDMRYIKDWYEGKIFKFSDTYRFDTEYWGRDYEEMAKYIINDLKLIAGGGYNTEHINVISVKAK